MKTQTTIAADKETLEYLVDYHGLNEVLEMLADIAAEKSRHIEENWQDRISAATWERAADNLSLAAQSVFSRTMDVA